MFGELSARTRGAASALQETSLVQKTFTSSRNTQPAIIVGTSQANSASAIQLLDTTTGNQAGGIGIGAAITGQAVDDVGIFSTSGIALSSNGGSSIGLKLGGFVVTGGADISARGIDICKYVSVIENRTSNTTLTNSAYLTFAIPGAGTYAVDLCAYLYCNTSATGGLKANINFSGSLGSAACNYSGYALYTTPAFIQTTIMSTTVGAANANLTTTGLSIAQATPSALHLKGVLSAAGAGTLAFAFAQSASSTNGVFLINGSWMKVKQLS